MIEIKEVIWMPFVELTTGSGSFNEEEKKKLAKALYDSVIGVYQEVKGMKPHCWVVIREESPDSWVIDGETLTEVRKKLAA